MYGKSGLNYTDSIVAAWKFKTELNTYANKDCVSEWISKLHDEGKYDDHKQIVAIALSKCGESREQKESKHSSQKTRHVRTSPLGKKFFAGTGQKTKTVKAKSMNEFVKAMVKAKSLEQLENIAEALRKVESLSSEDKKVTFVWLGYFRQKIKGYEKNIMNEVKEYIEKYESSKK